MIRCQFGPTFLRPYFRPLRHRSGQTYDANSARSTPSYAYDQSAVIRPKNTMSTRRISQNPCDLNSAKNTISIKCVTPVQSEFTESHRDLVRIRIYHGGVAGRLHRESHNSCRSCSRLWEFSSEQTFSQLCMLSRVSSILCHQRVPHFLETESHEVPWIGGREILDAGMAQGQPQANVNDSAEGKAPPIGPLPDPGHDGCRFDEQPVGVFPQNPTECSGLLR